MPPSSLLGSLGPPELFALGLALALTLVIGVALRRRYAAWVIAGAAFFPVPAVALFSAEFNVVGWHAYMHAAPIYQIMARGGVPEDPLYAGGSLRYPWVEFWLTAMAARLTGVNPLVLTLIAQTIAYAVFIGAAAWLVASLSAEPTTVALGALLSAFGVSLFHAGLFAEPLGRAFPPLWLETRVVPLDKFLSVTAMPLGYAAMLLAAAALVRLAAGMGSVRRLSVCAGSCTLFAVFIHPLSWLGIIAVLGAAGSVSLASRDRQSVRRLGWGAVAVGIPSALALPYLGAVGTSQSTDGWMGITRSSELLGAKAVDLGFFLALFLLLAYLNRQALWRLLQTSAPARILGVTIVGLSAAYLIVRAPGRNEYKFLLQLAPCAAVFTASFLRSLLDRQRTLGLCLLFLLLIPGAHMLGVRPWFSVTDPARLDGQYQRAVDPAADRLYQWVAHETAVDAVFIAADLRMPPLGRRSLYVAVDAPWQGRDGWGLARNSLLQWHVRRPDAEMYRRQSLATIVLSPDWALPPSRVMAEIGAAVPGRPLYVHSTSAEVSAKLDATPGFSRSFANEAGTIHTFSGPAGAGATNQTPGVASESPSAPPAPGKSE